jgi:excisionase family DNA binding protein
MPRSKAAGTPSPVPAVQPILVNIKTASQMLGTTVWSVRELLWAKKIPHVQIGRRYLVDPADLQAYVEKLKAGAA